MTKQPELIEGPLECLTSGYILTESPVADEAGTVYFADVRAGGVYSLVDRERTLIIPHRKGIGGMARHELGGFVVSGRNVAHKHGDETVVLLDRDVEEGRFIFNDLTADAVGRIYVGAFATNSPWDRDSRGRAGSLVCVDVDGTASTIDDDLTAPNGMAFAPDGLHLYVIETGRCVVWRYPVEGGRVLGARELFFDFDDDKPDGMAVTADGSVWVAMARSGAVVVISPTGEQRARLGMPTPMVSSLAFGGPDLRTLFICTGTVPQGEQGGAVYRTRSSVPGLPAPVARVRPVVATSGS